LLSLPPGTEMFQFPGFPLPALCVQTGVTRHDPCRVSPFGHPRIKARLAAPRGLSQPPTSFIGFWRLGIHHVPFVTWQLQRCSRSLCSSQGSRPDSCHPPCRMCRPVRGSGRASWRGARAPEGETLPQSSTVCAAETVPFRRSTPSCGGGTRRAGERPDRIASDRDPGATRPVSGPGSWRPSCEGRGESSFERR
jgi:hypothetical protein